MESSLSLSPISVIIILGSLVLILLQISGYFANDSIERNVDRSSSFAYPPVLYGHIHMAKTAGTTIVGELSMNYERVCGNKGYSYDAYQTNERMREHQLKTNDTAPSYESHDMVSRLWTNYNRGKYPLDAMEEIGFEDCDYVSIEKGWRVWPDLFREWPIPVELHVSCRDPLDHLLSFLNHKNHKLRCTTGGELLDDSEILSQVEKISWQLVKRFSMKLKDIDNFNVKCFDFQNTSNYMTYMEGRLERKRFETDYVFRSPNKPRNKTNECIWAYPELQKMMHDYLLEHYDYYKFCSQCLGSKDDLLSNII